MSGVEGEVLDMFDLMIVMDKIDDFIVFNWFMIVFLNSVDFNGEIEFDSEWVVLIWILGLY